jgi:hypothetical protein
MEDYPVTYVINQVEYQSWPNVVSVESTLSPFSLSIEYIKGVLLSCSYASPHREEKGFQINFGKTLQNHISTELSDKGLHGASNRYSNKIKEISDLAFEYDSYYPRMFIEIEFRPNVEKDLVKFQIGANNNTLAVAVLILTLDRNNINPQYTTMPEFAKFINIIDELRPQYPLLMLGFSGIHF